MRYPQWIHLWVATIGKQYTIDKLVLQSANKGVAKSVFPVGDEPFSTFDPSKTIHCIASSRSFNARMVTSPIISGGINKGLVNLDVQVKKIMGVKPLRLEDIQD